jgi:fumarate hydratase subunit beta
MSKIKKISTELFHSDKSLELPIKPEALTELKAGELINLNGSLFTGRDQTHRRLIDLLDRQEPLPVDLKNQLLYYVGPSPAKPGQVIGACGPTTSYRMDLYTPRLLELGLKATMGKGARSKSVRRAMKDNNAVYLAAIGGAGAALSKCIISSELIAFEDAGPEALFRFEVRNFPAIVVNDCSGADYYEIVASEAKAS